VNVGRTRARFAIARWMFFLARWAVKFWNLTLASDRRARSEDGDVEIRTSDVANVFWARNLRATRSARTSNCCRSDVILRSCIEIICIKDSSDSVLPADSGSVRIHLSSFRNINAEFDTSVGSRRNACDGEGALLIAATPSSICRFTRKSPSRLQNFVENQIVDVSASNGAVTDGESVSGCDSRFGESDIWDSRIDWSTKRSGISRETIRSVWSRSESDTVANLSCRNSNSVQKNDAESDGFVLLSHQIVA